MKIFDRGSLFVMKYIKWLHGENKYADRWEDGVKGKDNRLNIALLEVMMDHENTLLSLCHHSSPTHHSTIITRSLNGSGISFGIVLLCCEICLQTKSKIEKYYV